MANYDTATQAAKGAAGLYSSGNDTAQGYIDAGEDAARSYLEGGRTGANGYYGQGADALYRSNYGAQNAVAQGTQDAVGRYDQNRGTYADLFKGYGTAADLYRSALGLNGQAGSDAARAAFAASPGYNWQVGQGLDAMSRIAAAGGGVGGNAMVDGLKYAQGQAAGEWNNWLTNLGGFNGLQLAAAQGMADANNAAAGTIYKGATDRAGLESDYGKALASLYQGQAGMNAGIGGQEASNAMNAADKRAGYAYGSASDSASAIANAAIADQKAKLQAEANSNNFLASLINSAATLGGAALGGPAGAAGGSFLSKLLTGSRPQPAGGTGASQGLY